MNKEQFAPCPFCGKSDTLTIGKASDAFSELDDCGDPLPYMHTESYSVVCDSSKPDGPGGCGASGGYFPSEHEAVAAWNRRAEVERLAAQAEPAPAPVGEYPAKALEVVEPVACLVETEWGVMVWPISDIDEAGTYCDEGEFPELLYSATTVSALRERIAELESELRRVTTSPPTGGAPCARLCEHMAFQIQAKSDARRIAELEQDAVRGEPVGWQPLATAPKDGKEFIVRYPLQMNCKQLVYWNLIHGFWMTKGEALMGLGNQQAEWHPLPEDEPLPKETP